VEKPREIAVQVLRRYAEQADYLENILDAELRHTFLLPPDRALVQELTFGVIRWQAALDWLIGQKTAERPQKTVLQILLRLGLYQLFWLERIPDHAAVHETVEIAKKLGFSRQAGFINAVLRSYLRAKAATEAKLQELKIKQPSLGYSHPDWLIDRWKARWGHEVLIRLLEWNNTPPPLFARHNTLKTTQKELTASWEKEGVQFLPRKWDWVAEGLVYELTSRPFVSSLTSFKKGYFYIQDPGTLLAGQALDPRPGDEVLDLCAAPGGKTTFIAQRMQNLGRILAQDISQERLELVQENCTRLGVNCVQTSLLSTVSSDKAPPHFIKVLVDAPCSNTGVMRRRVDLRWRIRLEEIHRLRITQSALLARAALQVKTGGIVVYSTCTLEPEENSQVVREFLNAHPSFRLAEERTLLPFVEGVDGAYVAKIIRQDST
jgi:16S rRNA (cytosine967-C5)-methyltransferase